MSVVLIELVEMTATINVVVSINSTTVMPPYWTAPSFLLVAEADILPEGIILIKAFTKVIFKFTVVHH